MATHDVTFTLPPRKLGRSDVTFQIARDGETFGTLTVSNGSMVWFPKGASKGRRVGWKKFNELMKEGTEQFERR